MQNFYGEIMPQLEKPNFEGMEPVSASQRKIKLKTSYHVV